MYKCIHTYTHTHLTCLDNALRDGLIVGACEVFWADDQCVALAVQRCRYASISRSLLPYSRSLLPYKVFWADDQCVALASQR